MNGESDSMAIIKTAIDKSRNLSTSIIIKNIPIPPRRLGTVVRESARPIESNYCPIEVEPEKRVLKDTASYKIFVNSLEMMGAKISRKILTILSDQPEQRNIERIINNMSNKEMEERR